MRPISNRGAATGPDPVEIAIDAEGCFAYVVNMGVNGSIEIYALDGSTGVPTLSGTVDAKNLTAIALRAAE
jgi:DNA-binding beta-propeller fold protein YncE